jgi:hypothetical protein
MSGDIMSTWPTMPIDPGRQSTNYEGKILYEGRDFRHVRPGDWQEQHEREIVRRILAAIGTDGIAV